SRQVWGTPADCQPSRDLGLPIKQHSPFPAWVRWRRRSPQPRGKGVGREGRRSGDQSSVWEWGRKELADEAQERPERGALEWQRNMGPETENVDLGEHGDQKERCLPGNCPNSCLVCGCGWPSRWWEAAAATTFPAKRSSPRGSRSSWVRLPGGTPKPPTRHTHTPRFGQSLRWLVFVRFHGACHLVGAAGEMQCQSPAAICPQSERLWGPSAGACSGCGVRWRSSLWLSSSSWVTGLFLVVWFKLSLRLCLVRQTILVFMSSDFPGFSLRLLGFIDGLFASDLLRVAFSI
ncbi:hypothetical protein HPG69_012469, partial [Diceros bicornis minor]